MLKWIIFLVLSTAYASEKFISISYYDGLGQKFRSEKVVSFDDCKEKVSARKIFLHEKNELREVAYWDEKGKMHEASATSNPEVRAIVEEAFSQASTAQSPCMKSESVSEKSTSGSTASEQ